MLRVKVEIVPFGQEDKAREIARLDIFNKGQAEFGHCTYGVIEIDKEKNTGFLHDQEVLHRRELGALELIRKVLTAIK